MVSRQQDDFIGGIEMPKLLPAVTSIGLVLAVSTASQANITYSINQSSTTPEVGGELSPLSDTVLGTITTDGTIGVLQSSNILSWNLQLRDNFRPAYDVTLTPANSGIWLDIGDGLSATASGLSFDFSKAGAVFIIQGTTHGFSSGYQYFCFQATGGPCLTGETIVPYYYSVDGTLATGFRGPVSLGAPEPATWAMMLLGFGSLGAVMRSPRRMRTA
jgi:hypothetical protein